MKSSQELRPLLIMGTRPEAIKMAPLVQACQERPGEISPIVCFTGQHREMLQQVADYFGITADIDLQLMAPNQTLAELTARCLTGLEEVICEHEPDCLVAQGDTTTAMAAAMAAFYRRLPFVHVEAGLRTGNLQSPWPEEYNRRVVGLTADVHCAPTERAARHLRDEGVDPDSVHVTGNTVIDALIWTRSREREGSRPWNTKYDYLADRPMVLITGHRRENFGPGFESICQAIAQLAGEFGQMDFVYPVHLNPNVREPVQRLLRQRNNVHLVEPVPYPEFVWLMDRCTIILSDSGGVQEEAPSLRKPMLVMRDTTERPEAIEAGAVQLVGTSTETIVAAAKRLLEDPAEYSRRQIDHNPYGDGTAAAQILNLMASRPWLARDRARRAA